ncbi:type II toxin-antitoxin system PemK/MazF family toxin [Limnohabitans sp. JirII-29]|uniref:type II toxin-antitoxin system PemK/MazF family toxin n=1 Tax=Limnohabitans sp. JirII-29 TaxID=1835756 RepID=UPI002100DD2D|nr:type II toxin-antitoxin system PemK/MazF family toxin [Limnohabitans sp. JirII-29]
MIRTATFRVSVELMPGNGLRHVSQVMVDKLSTLPRSKVSEPFGHLEEEKMREVERAMLLVIDVI